MKYILAALVAVVLGISSAYASTRTTVPFSGRYAAGTIVVVNSERALYLVTGEGTALRYDVAVGKPGAELTGIYTVRAKAVNPSWTPTPNMRKKNSKLRRIEGGTRENPLGARALYLKGLYRIHGTNAPGSIGTAASSGCIRMHNVDVIDLYRRVGVGTPVVVLNRLKDGRTAAK